MNPIPRSAAVAFLLAAVLLSAFATAQSPDPAAPAGLAAQVRERVAALLQETGAPGLSVAVGIGDRVVLAEGFGLADLENAVPATADTVYRLASISKPVTAVLALMLRDQGRLDLDADVATLLPEWPRKEWPVSTRQLLGHLGGVRHYRRGEAESTVHHRDALGGLTRFAGDPLLHQPGSRYLYSTYGYNLAAMVLEKATGQPFPALVRERIAAVAGAASLRDDDVRAIIRHRAQGYVKQGGALQNSELMDPSYKLGGGGLCSNAPDLVRFGLALMGGRLLAEPSLREAWTEQRTADGKGTGYGLGFRLATRDGLSEVHHTGAQARVATVFCLLPEQRVAVVLLCNLEGTPLLPTARAIAAAAAAPAGAGK